MGSTGSRRSIPAGIATQYDYAYPIAWFGILAESPPSTDEPHLLRAVLGVRLHSMRSPAISRLYLQVRPGTTRDSLTEDQIWAELDARLLEPGDRLVRGPIIESTVVTMRSFMCEPMSYRRLFLVGDAAHIVPPSAAKGSISLSPTPRCSPTRWPAGTTQAVASCWTRAEVAGRRAWLGQEFSAVMTDLRTSSTEIRRTSGACAGPGCIDWHGWTVPRRASRTVMSARTEIEP